MRAHRPFARLAALLAVLPLLAPRAQAQTSVVPIRHVLLISVDGLHQEDLARCIAAGTCPHLAALARHGVTYTDAMTTRPSDSFPGMIAQVSGGTPRVTGVYYDHTFDRALYPAGSQCHGARGAVVRLTGKLDLEEARLDGGSPQGLTGNSATAIDPQRLPERLRHGHCAPLWPHNYLRVNTVFGVLHAHGLRTAWIDKHPAYDILNGPGRPEEGPGRNIDDFYAPEVHAILSRANLALTGPGGAGLIDPRHAFQDSTAAIQRYDRLKVRALIHEIDGFDHTGTRRVGTPALFGMDFQAVNVAQKRPSGGYRAPGAVPSAKLTAALAFVDRSIGRMVAALRRRGLAASTVLIISAKSGNTPLARSEVKIISDRTVLTPALEKLGAANRFHVADDVLLEWLTPAYRGRVRQVIASLIAQQAAGTDLGIGTFYSGPELDALFGNPRTDSRAPDFILEPRAGVIYANHVGKIAEHGGFHQDDRHVALLVANPQLTPGTVFGAVRTVQIAPTILRLLGLRPHLLQAVRREGTRPLPALTLRR